MSHNKITVASQSPDANGNVDVSFSNLSDVAGTPAANTYYVYDGNNFNPTSVQSVPLPTIFLAEGASDNYPRTLAAGEEVCFYASNPYNNITSATLNLLSGQTNWYESVTLPAGTYYLRGTCVGDFTSSATPNMTYAFKESTNSFGSHGASYDSAASGGVYPYESVAMIELTGSTTVFLNIETVSNANSTTTSNQSKYGHLLIMKVS